MAPSTVNPQITDAVTETNVEVVAEAPAFALASIYQTLAHSTGILMENAVNQQAQTQIVAQAATTQGVMQIYSVDTEAAAVAVKTLAQTGVGDNLTSLLTVLQAFQSEPGGAAGTVAAQPKTNARRNAKK